MELELTDCYGIGLGASLLLLWLVDMLGTRLKFLFNAFRPVILFGISRGEAVLFGVVVIANGLCAGIAVGTPEDVIDRLHHITLINLIPIVCGAHMNPVASLCRVRQDRYRKLHSWLGVIVTIEVMICGILMALQADTLGPSIPGILVASCLGGTLLSLGLQRRLFELFSWVHSVLATALMVALWLYLPTSALEERPRLYLLLCYVVFVSAKILRLVNIIYRSMSFQGTSIAKAQDIGGAVEIRVWPARTLNFQAGQYIYLSLAGLSWVPLLSAFEFHPFQITWSYRDDEGRQVLVLLTKIRQGFTRRLSLSPPGERRAFIEGPYGRALAMGEYGTVLLVATGIGITGQLPYIKELLVLYRECKAKTRRIALFWELDAEVHRWWVRDWMDELLAADVDHVLDLKLFIRGQYLSEHVVQGSVQKLGSHDRIELAYAAMRPAWMIRSELGKRKGKTLISLCTDPETTQAITEGIGESFWDEDIRIEKLDFRPGRRLNVDGNPGA